MAQNSFKQLQTQPFFLAGSGSAIGAASIILTQLKDIDGNLITMTDVGDKGFFTIEPGNNTQEEAGTFTGITQNGDGTATLTGVKNQGFKDPYTETSGLVKSHSGGTTLIFTNTAGFYQNFLRLGDDNTVLDTLTFTNPNYPKMDTATPGPTADEQFATKKYVDGVAIAGAPDASTTVKGIVKMSSAPASPTSPVVLNNEEVSTTSGANKVVKANASGKIDIGFVSDGTSSGLEAGAGNGVQVKTSAGKNIKRTTDGIELDTTTSLPGSMFITGDGLSTSSLTLGNVYQNTSGRPIAVTVVTINTPANTPGAKAYTYGKIGATNSPATIVVKNGLSGQSQAQSTVGTFSNTLIIPNNYYYKFETEIEGSDFSTVTFVSACVYSLV